MARREAKHDRGRRQNDRDEVESRSGSDLLREMLMSADERIREIAVEAASASTTGADSLLDPITTTAIQSNL